MKRLVAILIVVAVFPISLFSQGEVNFRKSRKSIEVNPTIDGLRIYYTENVNRVIKQVQKNRALANKTIPILLPNYETMLSASSVIQISSEKAIEKGSQFLATLKENEIDQSTLELVQIAETIYAQLEKAIEESESPQIEEPEADTPAPAFSLLNQAFVDMFNNGKMQATGSVVKILVGSKTSKLRIPIYFLVSATGSNPIADEKNKNEIAFSGLINPIGGNINITLFKNDWFKNGNNGIDLLTQLSYRKLPVELENQQENKAIDNFYLRFGINLLTNAWNATDPTKEGYLLLTATGVFSYSPKKEDIRLCFGDQARNPIFGFTFEGELAIESFIKVKLGYYYLDMYKSNILAPITDNDNQRKDCIKFSISQQF